MTLRWDEERVRGTSNTEDFHKESGKMGNDIKQMADDAEIWAPRKTRLKAKKKKYRAREKIYTASITEYEPGVLGASGTEGFRDDEDSKVSSCIRRELSPEGVGGKLRELGTKGLFGEYGKTFDSSIALKSLI